MRPGQLTPENCLVGTLRSRGRRRFNEAGAINPGKPRRRNSTRPSIRRFNEAGAINPGKLLRRTQLPLPRGGASMRPGQLTPENCSRRRGCWFGMPSFNEAGAINPGKRRYDSVFCKSFKASMRPGQLTPENGSDSDRVARKDWLQ